MKINLPEVKQRVLHALKTTATIRLSVYGNQYRVVFTLVSNDENYSRLLEFNDACYYQDKALQAYYMQVSNAVIRQHRYEGKEG